MGLGALGTNCGRPASTNQKGAGVRPFDLAKQAESWEIRKAEPEKCATFLSGEPGQ